MNRLCSQCGTESTSDVSRFCAKCGAAFTDSVAAPLSATQRQKSPFQAGFEGCFGVGCAVVLVFVGLPIMFFILLVLAGNCTPDPAALSFVLP